MISGATKIGEKAMERVKVDSNTIKKAEQAIVATVNKDIKAVVSGTTQSIKVISSKVQSTAKAFVLTLLKNGGTNHAVSRARVRVVKDY